MVVFVVAFALWLAVPAGIFSLLQFFGSELQVATGVAALLFLLLPPGLQWVIAGRTIHPPWHHPGVVPSRSSSRRSRVRATGVKSDAADESTEVAFERALGEIEEHPGTLGKITGAAIQHYGAQTTDPMIDFQLPFKNVVIHCRDEWRRRATGEETDHTAAKRKMSDPPTPARVRNNVPSTYELRGWYIAAERARTLVVMVHGAGRDRRTFMRHAGIFHEAGYSTLLIDCREHGTSTATGAGVGFATREPLDVIQAARYAREHLGYTRVVACGTSMGGASSIIAAVLADEIELPGETHTGRVVSHSPSTSRSYRNSTTRIGGADSDDEDPLLEDSPRAGDTDPAAASNASQYATTHIIDAVIAENPFLSRESCVSDVMNRVLGRVPVWLLPLRWAKRLFIICATLAFRWRLGLFHPTRVSEWSHNWRRSCDTTEPAPDLHKPAISSHVAAAAHLPLTPIFARTSRLRDIAINDFNAIDLIAHLAPRPLLLMHGTIDEVVRPIHSQILYAQARDPKKMWLVSDAKHTALINTDRDGWKRTVIDFLAEHGL